MGLHRSLRLALLQQVPRLWPLAAPPAGEGSRRRILVLRPDHVGDVLLATPALRALRVALPRAHLTCLVGPWAADVLRHNPNVDELLTCPVPAFSRRPKGAPWAPYALLARQARVLRAGAFDLAINLRFDFWWGALLAHAAGIPVRWGYAWPEVRPFLSNPVAYGEGRHEVVQSLALVQAVIRAGGVAQPLEASVVRPGDAADDLLPLDAPLDFTTSPAEEDFAANWAQQLERGAPLVALHVGAGAPVKLWDVDAFARVGDGVVARWRAQVVLVGGPGEEGRVEAVARQMAVRPATLVGRSLGEVGAMLRRCRLAIGVDSGIMHLAVAVGTPSVALYGPVDAARFGPWGPAARHVVVTANLPCVPCNRLDYAPSALSQHRCLATITPAQVLAASERVWTATC